jgi:hypothetical protein
MLLHQDVQCSLIFTIETAKQQHPVGPVCCPEQVMQQGFLRTRTQRHHRELLLRQHGCCRRFGLSNVPIPALSFAHAPAAVPAGSAA